MSSNYLFISMSNLNTAKVENKPLATIKIVKDLNQYVSISLNKELILSGIEHQSLWFLEKNLEEVVNELVTSILENVQGELEHNDELKATLPFILEERRKFTFKKILKAVGSNEFADIEYRKLIKLRKTENISLQDFITYRIDPSLTNEIDNPAVKLI